MSSSKQYVLISHLVSFGAPILAPYWFTGLHSPNLAYSHELNLKRLRFRCPDRTQAPSLTQLHPGSLPPKAKAKAKENAPPTKLN